MHKAENLFYNWLSFERVTEMQITFFDNDSNKVLQKFEDVLERDINALIKSMYNLYNGNIYFVIYK